MGSFGDITDLIGNPLVAVICVGNKSRVIEDHQQDPELCEFSNDSDSNDDMDTPRDDGLNSPNDQSKPYHMMDSQEKRR